MYERRGGCSRRCLYPNPLLQVAVTAFSADLELYAPLIKVGLLLVLLVDTGLKRLYVSVAALDCCLLWRHVLVYQNRLSDPRSRIFVWYGGISWFIRTPFLTQI